MFFTVVGKAPQEVGPGDVLAFVTAQRTGQPSIDGVLQPVADDAETGVPLSTVRRRLSIVSGLYGFLQVSRGYPQQRSRPAETVINHGDIPRS